MLKIAIINGPNLNLLGKREVEIYGTQSFENYFKTIQSKYPTIELSYFQSNIEGELINTKLVLITMVLSSMQERTLTHLLPLPMQLLE